MVLRLITHITEKGFRMIRDAGFLSNRLRGKRLPLVYSALEMATPQRPNKPSYEAMFKRLTHVDPFECILCQHRMHHVATHKGLSVAQLHRYRFDLAEQKQVNR